MKRALGIVLFAAAAAASCHKSPSLPGELDNPNIQPSPPSGGGGDGGTIDGHVPDGGTACGEAPSILAGFTPSRILYIAADGSDSNDGATRATAWRSFTNLAAQLQPGDRVDVFTGNYDCNAEIGVHATAQRPVWIHSVDGPLKAVLNCGGAGFGMHLVSAKYVVVDGFDIVQPQIDGIHVDSGSGPTFPDLADNVVLQNNHVHSTGAAGIHVTQATNVWVFQNEVDTTEAFGPNAGGQGIDLVAVNGARVIANNVHDVRTNVAIQVRGGAFSTRVAANRLANNQEAVHLGGLSDRPFFLPNDSAVEAQGVVAHSNIVTGATNIAFAAYGCQGCTIANNTIYLAAATQPIRGLAGNTGSGSTATQSHTINLRVANNIFYFTGMTPTDLFNIPSSEETGFLQSNNLFFVANGSAATINTDVPIGGTGTLVDKDPLFTNAGSGDFTLATSSPASMAAIPIAEVSYNVVGACRTSWNIGAY